jgi:hypothetical protein
MLGLSQIGDDPGEDEQHDRGGHFQEARKIGEAVRRAVVVLMRFSPRIAKELPKLH